MTIKPWNRSLRIGILAIFVCLRGGLLADEKEVQIDGVRQAKIKRLIEQLDAPSFQEREKASLQLTEIGEPAVELLDEATRGTSTEARNRAQAILKNLQVRPLRAAFVELAKLPDEKMSVEHGMWLIARVLNPKVRREDLNRQLNEITNSVKARLGANVDPRTADPTRVVEAMRVVLFEEYKFIGNVADYDNPDNNSLEKVLSTRKGLPIMLSHIVVAVGQRLGVPIVGLPTPGRYIVKYDASRKPAGAETNDIFMDPFNGGKILSTEDLTQLFPSSNLAAIAPSTSREVLIRMMRNLERHLFDRNQTDKGYQVLEFRQILANESPEEEM